MFFKGCFRSFWFSSWTRWVGLRYLKSKKHSMFLSFITMISILGVGIGVTSLIVVLSVMDGFEKELESHLMVTDLHILITPHDNFSDYKQGFVPKGSFEKTAAYKMISEINGTQIWSVVSTEVILRTSRKVTGVIVKGVAPQRLQFLKKQLTETAAPQLLIEKQGGETLRLPSVFIGHELAYEMGILPGDNVTLVSPTETEGPLGNVPRLKRFVVAGVYHTGLPEQELHTVFTDETNVYSFLKKSDVVTSWEITLKDFKKAPSLSQKMQPLVSEKL
ncbi:MAG: ABC transporter permease, partial [Bdellovibrio sp.]|nr:ABC transporter permease [Bdellovibrio sp.]